MKKDIAIFRSDNIGYDIDELINLLTKYKDMGGTSVDMYSSYDGEFEMVIHSSVEMTEEEEAEFNEIKYKVINVPYIPRAFE